MAIETVAVKAPSFVPVDQNTFDKQNIIITKRDVRIEFPCDTEIGTVTNIIGALLLVVFCTTMLLTPNNSSYRTLN